MTSDPTTPVSPVPVVTGPAGAGRRPRLVRTPPAAPPPPPSPEALAVTALVERLRAQWQRQGADVAARCRPGADPAQLDAAERTLDLPLPAGVRAWFTAFDGVDATGARRRREDPSVGPGGWVPLPLQEALRACSREGGGPALPPGLLPLLARDGELLTARLRPVGGPAVVEHLVLTDDGDAYQHSWRVPLVHLLGVWAQALTAVVHWLPDTHDWVSDPFALQALPDRHLLG